MIRTTGELLALFTIPFVLYAVWHVLRLRNPFTFGLWTRRVVAPLVFAGLGFAVGGLLVLGLSAPRYEGGYVPAHLENGRVVPGHMR